ncbi:hypothetical protein SARC_00092 [Sphaeroforma arctica JP610]|uniref:ATP-dependent helicase C-terminal domain-containing protein n=1 Tax=Sphaeroforma arctica JP610 TaxID=667725 RepID=A0A0L0GFI0_9EUKA|nr:hypothetical protein SARC_00092 [Sphaeroforma arctica JP610]KNC87835.1 hypothetical protein SARC_00092 [Sphaeroforma arctica JP610]|eukprot:XP_014161737.1 hypothetical protein SARC_00092 [Sphaeroforma arctica JP610]
MKDLLNGRKLYPHQQRAVDELLGTQCAAGVYFLNAPTGCGKSIMSVALCASAGGSIITTTKALQWQYEADFPEVALLMGRGNYQCALAHEHEPLEYRIDVGGVTKLTTVPVVNPCPLDIRPAWTDKEGKAVYPTGPHYDECAYPEAVRRFTAARVTVSNFALHSFRPKEADCIVVDEAHELEATMREWGSLRRALDERPIGGICFLAKRLASRSAPCKAFLEAARDVQPLSECMSGVDTDEASDAPLAFGSPMYNGLMRYHASVKAMMGMLAHVQGALLKGNEDPVAAPLARLEALDKKLCWVRDVPRNYLASLMSHYSTGERELHVTLRNLAPIFKKLFGAYRRVYLVSATIVNPGTLCAVLGIRYSDTHSVHMESQFPAANHAIRDISNNVQVLARTLHDQVRDWQAGLIDTILDKHAGQRGLVMTASHEHAELIVRYTKPRSSRRMLLVKSNLVPVQCALELARDVPDMVYVSSSMHTGVDLPGDLSEFQIIAKIPRLSPHDPIVKYNRGKFAEWYDDQAAMGVIQRLGRSVRQKTDIVHSYFLDRLTGPIFRRLPETMVVRFGAIDDMK